jgi:hypothetical protein
VAAPELFPPDKAPGRGGIGLGGDVRFLRLAQPVEGNRGRGEDAEPVKVGIRRAETVGGGADDAGQQDRPGTINQWSHGRR